MTVSVDTSNETRTARLRLLGAWNVGGLIAFVVAALLLAVRLQQSIDLTDEAYYAAFIDDWLKGGLRTSSLSTLHETSALIVYPFAILYERVSGGSSGLFLFLRCLYLAFACVMALIWWRFMQVVGMRRTAWPLAIAAVGFVPFGLPAPSYNTLAMQSVAIALSAFALAHATGAKDKSSGRPWLLVSVMAAAVATVAYPPLIAFVLVFGSLTFLVPNASTRSKTYYLAGLAAAFGLAWAAVIAALTWQGLVESFVNVSVLNSAGDIGRKLSFTIELLLSHKAFSLMLALAIALGLARPWVPFWVAATILGVITLSCFLGRPALFVRSHDIITLWCATGLWLLLGFRPSAKASDRLIAIVYASSIVAGAITAASATWSPYNFCIGCFPASLLAVAFNLRGEQPKHVLATSALAAAVLLLGVLQHFMTDRHEPQAKIRWGFFAGVSAPLQKVEMLEYMRDHVGPLVASEKTILVIGRMPGLALATAARPLAIWVWFLQPGVSPQSPEYLRQFYVRDPAHRPKVVVIYKDDILDAVNPMGASFPEWYREVERKSFSSGEISIFERK